MQNYYPLHSSFLSVICIKDTMDYHHLWMLQIEEYTPPITWQYHGRKLLEINFDRQKFLNNHQRRERWRNESIKRHLLWWETLFEKQKTLLGAKYDYFSAWVLTKCSGARPFLKRPRLVCPSVQSECIGAHHFGNLEGWLALWRSNIVPWH